MAAAKTISYNNPKHQRGRPHPTPRRFLKSSIFFVITFISLFTFLQTRALNFSFRTCSIFTSTKSINSSSSSSSELARSRSMLRDSITFLPLKDLRFSNTPMTGHTWFMSSLNDTHIPNRSEHIPFPSPSTNGRLLCLSGRDVSDGTRNSYALAFPEALPPNAALLRGTTFVSDTYYDYDNPWHGLAAVVPLAGWYKKHGGCGSPARWALFHWGEMRRRMGAWVRSVAESAIGGEVRIETFEHAAGPTCFEKAVVFRHNEGGMPRASRMEVYDMVRCRARVYCNWTREDGDGKKVRVTLFFRAGTRSFKNEPAVVKIFEGECRKVEGCSVRLVRPVNLTFCEQVKLMSDTDVLVSPHGAQLTNMIFMDRNSSVLEFFPRGWLELAGVGQYVYKWMTEWSGMRQQGQWRDPEGEECPNKKNKEACFSFYKDGRIGHNVTYFSSWAARVIKETREFKISKGPVNHDMEQTRACSCG